MESYTVRFWIQKADGYWEKREEVFKGKNKNAHNNVKLEFTKKYPKAKLISIIYQ